MVVGKKRFTKMVVKPVVEGVLKDLEKDCSFAMESNAGLVQVVVPNSSIFNVDHCSAGS